MKFISVRQTHLLKLNPYSMPPPSHIRTKTHSPYSIPYQKNSTHIRSPTKKTQPIFDPLLKKLNTHIRTLTPRRLRHTRHTARCSQSKFKHSASRSANSLLSARQIGKVWLQGVSHAAGLEKVALRCCARLRAVGEDLIMVGDEVYRLC